MAKIIELFLTLFNNFPHTGIIMVFVLAISGVDFAYNSLTYAENHDIQKLSEQTEQIQIKLSNQIKQGQIKNNVNDLRRDIRETKRELFAMQRLEKEELSRRDKRHIDELKIYLSDIEDKYKSQKDKLK